MLALLSVALLLAVAVPLASIKSVRASQQAVRDGNLSVALERANDAADLLPALASPHLQQALVLEQGGDLNGAAAAAQEAVARDRNDWRNWLILARIKAEQGQTGPALAAYRHAKAENPRSPLFTTTSTTAPDGSSANE